MHIYRKYIPIYVIFNLLLVKCYNKDIFVNAGSSLALRPFRHCLRATNYSNHCRYIPTKKKKKKKLCVKHAFTNGSPRGCVSVFVAAYFIQIYYKINLNKINSEMFINMLKYIDS